VKRITAEDVIRHATRQWKTFRDGYVKTLEEAAPIKRQLSEEEKDVAYQLYLKGHFGEAFTLDDYIREALKEHARRSKLPDDKLAKLIKDEQESRESMFRGVDES